MGDPKLSIVAPAYNEEENLQTVVRRWEEVLAKNGTPGEIVIANDGSTDRTAEVLAELQGEFPNLVVLTHEVNGGYGRAMASAIAASRGEFVLTIDSDGQFDAADYPQLMTKLLEGNLDGVTGYRMGKKDSAMRVLADRGLNAIVRLLFRVPLRDTNCALKLFRGDVLRGISIDAMGFPTPTEIVVKSRALGYKLGEVGVGHFERPGGKSKLHAIRTSLEMLFFLIYLRLKVTLFKRRIITAL